MTIDSLCSIINSFCKKLFISWQEEDSDNCSVWYYFVKNNNIPNEIWIAIIENKICISSKLLETNVKKINLKYKKVNIKTLSSVPASPFTI